MSDLPATIETERLRLRPHDPGDADDILVYAVREDWSRYMPVPHPYARKDAEEWLAETQLADPTKRGAWAIECAGHVIGAIDLHFEPNTHSANLGYALSPAEWNKGFMTEVVGAVINHGFAHRPDLNRIWAWADARNGASLRVMAKLGMTREGCLREHRTIRGQFVDAIYCGILRREWNG